MPCMLLAGTLLAGMAHARTPLRSSFDLHVPLAPSPVVIAGTRQWVYELHLTNFAEQPLVVERVSVADAETGRELTNLQGSALDARLGRIAVSSGDAPRRRVEPGQRVVLYLEIALPEPAAPRALRHRIDYGTGSAPAVGLVESAPLAIAHTPALVLGPPLRGGPWAAVHDPAWPRGHRRVIYTIDGRARIPGRHAIDWVLLDGDGRSADGDEDRIDTWHGYGAEVLAVADGRVAAVRDDIAESPSIAAHPEHPLEDATGNYVALDLGGGRYAFYEHLRPGSVRVRPGERVRRGQVLGALGFTGDSTGPHLHFHVADAHAPLAAEGLPFVFDRFELLGRYEAFDDFGKRAWQPRDPALDRVRREERPPPNSVVSFGR